MFVEGAHSSEPTEGTLGKFIILVERMYARLNWFLLIYDRGKLELSRYLYP